MATLVQLRDRILSKYDRVLPTGSPTTAQVDAQINSTINFYSNDYFWFQQATATIALTPNDAVIPSIPSDYKDSDMPNEIVINIDSYKVPLKHVSSLEYDAIFNSTVGTRPQLYTYRNGQFEVYPVPDQAYDVEFNYRVKFADLVNDSDTNGFTENADRLVEYKTLADLLRDYKQDFTRAEIYERRAETELKQVLRETYRRVSTGSLTTDNIIDDGYVGGEFYS